MKALHAGDGLRVESGACKVPVLWQWIGAFMKPNLPKQGGGDGSAQMLLRCVGNIGSPDAGIRRTVLFFWRGSFAYLADNCGNDVLSFSDATLHWLFGAGTLSANRERAKRLVS